MYICVNVLNVLPEKVVKAGSVNCSKGRFLTGFNTISDDDDNDERSSTLKREKSNTCNVATISS